MGTQQKDNTLFDLVGDNKAVAALRIEAALPAPASQAPQDCEPAGGDAPGDSKPEFARIENLLFSAIKGLTRLSAGNLNTGQRLEIQACVLMAAINWT